MIESSDQDQLFETKLHLDGFIDKDHAYKVRAEAYTRPHLVFRADNYFIDYWLPLLGPTSAWFVVALQQTCWQGSKPGNSTQASQTELGEQCGLGRQRVNELLPDPLVSRFIIGKQAMFKAGQRQPNSYRVRLTSPLIPAHAAGLQREIAVRLDDGETLNEVLQSLIDEATTARTALLERIALPGTPAPHTITDIVRGFSELDKTLRQQINDLAGLLLQPEQRQIEQHYLRREWLPLLGHAGTWLIMVIRRDCYADGEEVRDEFSVEKAALAGRLGVSAATIKRLVKNEHLPAFFRPAESDAAWQPGRYRLEGRVRMGSNPLTPADRKSLVDQVALDAEPPKGDTVNRQKATRLDAERSKGDTVNGQKATRSDTERSKGDTVGY